MKYSVQQKYYNDGTILATVNQVPDNTKEEIRTTDLCDVYVDVFDNRQDAERFKLEALEA